MNLELTGKKALVMGASQGIGLSIAKSLAAEGAHVAICSRSKDKIQKAAREVGAKFALTCDLSKKGEGKRVTEEAIEKLGGLDIIVINTGGPKKGNFSEISLDQWEEDYQSLWLSLVESLQACLPLMQKQKFGRVLTVTSLAAKEPLPGLTTSNGLRAGLAGLNRSLVNEYAKDGITLNLLLPGYTNTDRLKALNLSDERVKEMVPAGRLGEPEEVGDLACFLASLKAGYINGQSIVIDGGVLRSH